MILDINIMDVSKSKTESTFLTHATMKMYGVFINLKVRGYSSQIIFISNAMLYRRRLDSDWGAWKKVTMSDI